MRICQQQLPLRCRTEETLGDFSASVQKIKIKYWTNPEHIYLGAGKGWRLFSPQQPMKEAVIIWLTEMLVQAGEWDRSLSPACKPCCSCQQTAWKKSPTDWDLLLCLQPVCEAVSTEHSWGGSSAQLLPALGLSKGVLQDSHPHPGCCPRGSGWPVQLAYLSQCLLVPSFNNVANVHE